MPWSARVAALAIIVGCAAQTPSCVVPAVAKDLASAGARQPAALSTTALPASADRDTRDAPH
jgi:hypothetical protein